MSETREFNMNDTVLVRLTPEGHEQYRKSWNELRLEPPPLKSEEDGWTRFQLWDLCNTFGPALYNGSRVPFETTIRLEFPAPPSMGEQR
jgi:hypothetical protein